MDIRRSRVTIHDVARMAGVSVSTVSKALNGGGRMTQATRDLIKAVAAEAGFRPNALARSLLSSRSFTVGLITNDTYGRFTLPLMSGISEELVDRGVSVFLCAIEDNANLARIHVDAMMDKQVDGIIATGKRIDSSLPVDLSRLPVPVVYAFTKGVEGSVVLACDDAHGARLAVERMGAVGRKKLLHITGPRDFAAAVDRAEAFSFAAGPEARVLYGSWSEAWGYEAVTYIWDSLSEKPDGIFCGNDQIARGVVDALKERGALVPGDVSVIGFDNWEIFAAQTRPGLTSIDMNLKELGRIAGRTVVDLAEGRNVQVGYHRHPCRLVVRGSCGGSSPPV